MLRRHKSPQRSEVRRSAPTGARGARLSYANVVASLALFVALGGTAAAAVTLPRDSVGAPEIRKDAVGSAEVAKDAVRSPEITKDAVRSPEIRAEAVRTSEIEDKGVRLADISDSTRTALEGANVRIAEGGLVRVPLCPGTVLRNCANLVELSLGSNAPDDARNWLVQAKMSINTPDGTADDFNTKCGLVMAENQAPTAVIDDMRVGALPGESEPKVVALTGVVTERARNPLMAVRCTMPEFDEIDVADMTITAIEVGTLTGP